MIHVVKWLLRCHVHLQVRPHLERVHGATETGTGLNTILQQQVVGVKSLAFIAGTAAQNVSTKRHFTLVLQLKKDLLHGRRTVEWLVARKGSHTTFVAETAGRQESLQRTLTRLSQGLRSRVHHGTYTLQARSRCHIVISEVHASQRILL